MGYNNLKLFNPFDNRRIPLPDAPSDNQIGGTMANVNKGVQTQFHRRERLSFHSEFLLFSPAKPYPALHNVCNYRRMASSRNIFISQVECGSEPERNAEEQPVPHFLSPTSLRSDLGRAGSAMWLCARPAGITAESFPRHPRLKR